MTQGQKELRAKIDAAPLRYFVRRSIIGGIFVAFALFLFDMVGGENTARESLLTGALFAVMLTIVDYSVYRYFRRKYKEK